MRCSSSGVKRLGSAGSADAVCWSAVAEWKEPLVELLEVDERREEVVAFHEDGSGGVDGCATGLTRSGRVLGPVALKDMLALAVRGLSGYIHGLQHYLYKR